MNRSRATPSLSAPFESPIVFVHGNGDSAALWHTTIWRFESNGWPRHLLQAIDTPCPLARDEDAQPQPGRSSTEEHMRHLAAEVERVRRQTGAARVVLVANSRGGLAVRNFVANGGGLTQVSHAVLGGTPNHGVWALPQLRPGNEFNGAGRFLSALNQRDPDGCEVPRQVAWMTLRSDANDKHAQALGDCLGFPGLATGVGADSPELLGALNQVLPGADHRETSFSPAAFAATYRFLTGHEPASLEILAEPRPCLSGKVLGQSAWGPLETERDNHALRDAEVEVHAVDPGSGRRLGPPLYQGRVDAEGRWGPCEVDPRTPLEFVVRAPGHAITHVYRSPFPRSSEFIHLRAEAAPTSDAEAAAQLRLVRPRGYFDRARDRVCLDGHCPPPGLPPGVASVSALQWPCRDQADRSVSAEFNGERITGWAWPADQGHVVVLELHS